MKWYTPLPWTTVDCEIDLRPVWDLQDRHALPRRAGTPERRLLSRNRQEPKADLDFRDGWGTVTDPLVELVKKIHV